MPQNSDPKKTITQHLEMDAFFTGNMSLKGKPVPPTADKSADDTPPPYQNNTSDLLDHIASEVKICQKCPLAKTRTNVVPGQGSPAARLVFVGEGPGADEDAQGIPFVGRAGQLLDKIIAAMTLKRSEVYICNIIKCRPPDNRDPKPDEIESCMPFLNRQLAAIGPEIIVALGAHAARTLLNRKDAIGKLRGRFHDYFTSKDAPPIKLMPTYHPAYLLRNYSPDNRKRVWEDMQKVMTQLGIEIPK